METQQISSLFFFLSILLGKWESFEAALAKVKTNPYVWVQAIHFLLAFDTFLLSYYFYGNLYATAVFIIAVTVYLECWFDPHHEHGPVVGKPDWDDLGFYMGGLISARLILLLPVHHR